MDKQIEVRGLVKNYGNVQAVKGIDFYVDRGSLFAFLGPNGAGKSTTIDIIATLLQADSGSVTIAGYTLGKDNQKIRQVIGAVFQDGVLDNRLTIAENLHVRGSLYGLTGQILVDAITKTADMTGTAPLLKRKYGELSGGQRRRCDIARALIHMPQILFLDEPTTGLDPQSRQAVWETIRTIQQSHEMTVFLTTHYMEEAASADYVVVIDEGQIVASGTPSQLKEQYSNDRLVLASQQLSQIEPIIKQFGYPYTISADTIEIKVPTTLATIPLITACSPYLRSFEVLQGTMDDAFITITGKDVRP